jgi:G3E family GTPase
MSESLHKLVRDHPRISIQVIGGFPDLGDENTCNQCALTNFILDQLDSTLNAAELGVPLDLLWINSPTELDVTRLTQAIEEFDEVRVRAVVTSIDQNRFTSDFTSDRSFSERFRDLNESPREISRTALDQPVLETLIDQIEDCDLIYLQGDQNEAVNAILARLNPGAQILAAEDFRRLDFLKEAFFDKEKTYRSAAWQNAIQSSHRETTPECFRSRRPFHPGRLNALIERWPESILRSYGTVWLASHNQLSLTLSQVGPSGFFFSPEGYWLATLSPLDQQSTLQNNPELKATWDPRHGDRMTEIAFVSDQPLTEAWIRDLEACVLTDFEMRLDWRKFENPFPTFEFEEGDSEENSIRSEMDENTSPRHLQLVDFSQSERSNP